MVVNAQSPQGCLWSTKMIEIKFPIVDVLQYTTKNMTLLEYLWIKARQGVDYKKYDIYKPNFIANDGYILVQFMENKNA